MQNFSQVNIINKNFQFVLTLLKGVGQAIKFIESQEYKLVYKVDFKNFHQVCLPVQFNKDYDNCKFYEYSPLVFNKIRQMNGISVLNFVESIGVNTFQNLLA